MNLNHRGKQMENAPIFSRFDHLSIWCQKILLMKRPKKCSIFLIKRGYEFPTWKVGLPYPQKRKRNFLFRGTCTNTSLRTCSCNKRIPSAMNFYYCRREESYAPSPQFIVYFFSKTNLSSQTTEKWHAQKIKTIFSLPQNPLVAQTHPKDTFVQLPRMRKPHFLFHEKGSPTSYVGNPNPCTWGEKTPFTLFKSKASWHQTLRRSNMWEALFISEHQTLRQSNVQGKSTIFLFIFCISWVAQMPQKRRPCFLSCGKGSHAY